MPSGFLLIDKPAGITSHDVVDRLRKITGIRRIGHAGTLDPFATGLLVVGVGREATKKLGEISGSIKEYLATAVLGAESDTQDKTGTIKELPCGTWPDEATVRAAMGKFTGEISQIPPMYSAKKIAGKKLYELARAGQEVERQPVTVTIHELELLEYSPPRLKFRVLCSSGTYIRTLAHDLGRTLGSEAYLEELRRMKVGQFNIEKAKKLDELTKDNWEGLLLQS
jgi:tRNA pseudouridine55 synthase